MSGGPPVFNLDLGSEGNATLILSGDWVRDQGSSNFSLLQSELYGAVHQLSVDNTDLGSWDSTLMAFLLQCHDYCQIENIDFLTPDLPEGAKKLLRVATAVKPHVRPDQGHPSWLQSINPAALVAEVLEYTRESLAFIGEITIALTRLIMGKANTRMVDFRTFIYQAGPEAFSIIGLTSVLVGMILAYLGAVQLLQFGAEIYVADLVVIGTLREMGADLPYENERVEGGEPVADLRAKLSLEMKGIEAPPTHVASMTDEYPVLSVSAVNATGVTMMTGVKELSVN